MIRSNRQCGTLQSPLFGSCAATWFPQAAAFAVLLGCNGTRIRVPLVHSTPRPSSRAMVRTRGRTAAVGPGLLNFNNPGASTTFTNALGRSSRQWSEPNREPLR
jgi:hypothetical protein